MNNEENKKIEIEDEQLSEVAGGSILIQAGVETFGTKPLINLGNTESCAFSLPQKIWKTAASRFSSTLYTKM